MIQKAERLVRTIKTLDLMNSAWRHLRVEGLPKNPRAFAPMAAGQLDELWRVQA
ncbi:MAG: hypothetical protein KIS67_25100 [Verrucomicrobiae bacterium]|nr:hypothetical protein [Verrucomicrobiae bacterium]